MDFRLLEKKRPVGSEHTLRNNWEDLAYAIADVGYVYSLSANSDKNLKGCRRGW